MLNIAKLKRDESLKDKCGVFGIFGRNEEVARISYYGLYSLQHRGQEGAGIAVSDGKKIRIVKGLGLVPSVFSEKSIASLKGHIAIGHTRYSTTGKNTTENVQPVLIHGHNTDLVLAHNGNIINAGVLADSLSSHKIKTSTDTEVMGWVIQKAAGRSWEEKVINSMNRFKGAFSIVAMTEKKLIAFRDPYGFRPLTLGRLNGSFIVCSESCALETIGANYIRSIKPGEVITIDDTGLHEIGIVKGEKKSFCLFEYVYLARPDSILNHELVHQVRQRSGELLSYESLVAADLVVAIPDSGTSAAIGYSKASGIPFGEILIKNRYIGRTFIQPEQRIREMGVKIKFNPLKKIVKGKRIIIVDDSIVRGTTIKKIIQLLRKCGAKKIHIRICSPPVKNPCYFGVDTPYREQLIASEKTVDQIKNFINADSLAFLTLSGLIRAARQKKNSLCSSCFNGRYPLPVDRNFSKTILEKKPLRLAIFISGSGTTGEAIIKAYKNGGLRYIEPVVVISSKKAAGGIQKAKKLDVATEVVERSRYVSKDAFGDAILKILDAYEIDLISQNGWLPLTPVNVIKRYSGKIINQHPGPLDPGRRNDFGGKGMYGARVICVCIAYAWLKGSSFITESTTHFVTPEYDKGNLIKTTPFKILPHPQKPTLNKLMTNKIWQELLIKETKNLQKKLLPIEHENVIFSLQLLTVNKVKGYQRDKPLIPEEDIELVNQAKKLAVKLFPYG